MLSGGTGGRGRGLSNLVSHSFLGPFSLDVK